MKRPLAMPYDQFSCTAHNPHAAPNMHFVCVSNTCISRICISCIMYDIDHISCANYALVHFVRVGLHHEWEPHANVQQHSSIESLSEAIASQLTGNNTQPIE